MNKKIAVSSRDVLSNEIKLLKLKRRELMVDIKRIESSLNDGLAPDCILQEVVIDKVVRALNERMHHSYLFFCGSDEGYDWFENDGGNITYNGEILYGFESAAESFNEVYKTCVDKIINDEGDDDMKSFMASLYFHGAEDNNTDSLFKRLGLSQ